MNNTNKKRILTWAIVVGISVILLLISNLISEWTYVNPNPTTIFVNAPETMVTAFENTFKKLGLNKDYVIETTDDVAKANFVVEEGMNGEGKLIAYSPIVAVFNSDSQYKNSLKEKEIFVKSEIAPDYEDFDFNKVIQEAISENGCDFKIYYPSKNSGSWDEFYSFMLFTVNDGYYPITDEEMERTKKIVEKFLNSKYAEPFNNATVERNHGIPENSIYFMAYADLARVYELSGAFSCRIMYPKTVVYHSYYAQYDELGEIIYDSLEDNKYSFLRKEGYNTKYSRSVSSIGDYVYGGRNTFNGVEIPGAEISIYKEEQTE